MSFSRKCAMCSRVSASMSTLGLLRSSERRSKLRVSGSSREAPEPSRSTPPGKCIRTWTVGLKPSFSLMGVGSSLVRTPESRFWTLPATTSGVASGGIATCQPVGVSAGSR
jgi:hypothetical protein